MMKVLRPMLVIAVLAPAVVMGGNFRDNNNDGSGYHVTTTDYIVAMQNIGHVNNNQINSTRKELDFQSYTSLKGSYVCTGDTVGKHGCVGSEGVIKIAVNNGPIPLGSKIPNATVWSDGKPRLQLEIYPGLGDYMVSITCAKDNDFLTECVYITCYDRFNETLSKCEQPPTWFRDSGGRGCTFVGSGAKVKEVEWWALCEKIPGRK